MADTGLRYDFEFSWDSTYARAARLIAATTRPGRVLDLGGGVGELADPVGRLGFGYIGGDIDPENLAAMSERGRTAFHLDLLGDDAVDRVLEAVGGQGGEPIVAITALDVIEHLPDPVATLDLIEAIADGVAPTSDPPVLVVSIPNVAHYDLAAKLLAGRWDVTEVGLLDATHVALFDQRRVEQLFAGWEELGRSDVVIADTEQRFPEGLPAFGATPFAEFLRRSRTQAGPAADTYQFVRAYRRRPDHSDAAAEQSERSDRADAGPFLTVLTRTTGDRSSLVDTLTSLAAQRDDDFEVQLAVHHVDEQVVADVRAIVADFAPSFAARVAVHHVAHGGRCAPLNVGLNAARGRYVAVLDDDDVVTSDWVAAFRRGAVAAPGRIVRAGVVVQWVERRSGPLTDVEAVTGFEAMYPPSIDLLDTIRANRSPPSSFATPMGVVRALDLMFDDTQRVAEDWKFQLAALRIVGATSVPEITSVYRRSRDGGSAAAESEQVWIEDLRRVIDDLDREPTLLPAGSLRRIHQLYERIEALERRLGDSSA